MPPQLAYTSSEAAIRANGGDPMPARTPKRELPPDIRAVIVRCLITAIVEEIRSE
jgi:hypothetical protein